MSATKFAKIAIEKKNFAATTLVRRVLSIAIFSATTMTLPGCATNTVDSSEPREPQVLSRSEKIARAEDLFDSMDLNGDGFLSREEMTSGLRHYTMAGDAKYDPNLMMGLSKGDAAKAAKSKRRKAKPMSEAEIQAAVDQAFSAQDINLDKRMSKDEFKKMVVEKTDTSAPWQEIL